VIGSGTTRIRAWNVCEGDRTRDGVVVVSVTRDVTTARVRIGLSNGGVLVTAGERMLSIRLGPR